MFRYHKRLCDCDDCKERLRLSYESMDPMKHALFCSCDACRILRETGVDLTMIEREDETEPTHETDGVWFEPRDLNLDEELEEQGLLPPW